MKMGKFVLLSVLFLGLVSAAFAGPFSGVGGDADYFPKNGPIVSAFVVPVLNFESVSSSTALGLEGVIGWSDLSFPFKYGKQGTSDFFGVGVRKRIFSEENMPFSCTLLWDADAIGGGNSSTNGSYLGAIFSKKVDNISPYVALLSTTYYTRTDGGVGPITYRYLYGSGLAGGARYDIDSNWAIRGEVNYNALSTSASASWPKSIMSMVVYGSWRR
jgi:hypothetical protein